MATYLITQATGQQSQWVVRHLLGAGAKVHAVSKNLDDILAAAQGCRGAFLNTVPFPGLESLQAKTIVEACQKAGVESLVAATTVCTADKGMWDDDETKEMGLHGYYASKAEVEDIVRAGRFQSYTILRPAVLHHDFFLPGAYGNFPRLPTHGELDDLLINGARVPYTDTYDLGKYAAAALRDPERFNGKEIDLGSELLTFEEVREVLMKASGRDIRVVKRTVEELEKMGASVFGQKFQLLSNIRDLSWITAKAKKVQGEFRIPFTPLSESVQRDKDRLLECLPDKQGD